MDDLSPLLDAWPVGRSAAAVAGADGPVSAGGDIAWRTRIASVAKLLVGMAALVATEEETVDLDEAAGPEGSTVRHLLAHASGLAFDDDRVLAPPGTRRIYSNTGIEVFADHLAKRAGMPFGEYLGMGVLEPLGMSATELVGSPAHDVISTVADLLRLVAELMAPTLVTEETLQMAVRPHFDELRGVVPGVGSFDPNTWGLTFEVRDAKTPHWTGRANSPSTFGHFGGAGTFLWVDPGAGIGCVALTDREYGDWALEVWPAFSDEVLRRHGGPRGVGPDPDSGPTRV